MTTEAGEMKRDLLASGKRAFSFLVAKGARVEVDDGAERSVLAYVLPRATFEVEYDWHEQAVFLLVCRTIEGARPGGYYMFARQRVRVHLLQALESAGLADEPLRAELRGATRRSGAAAMADQLAVLSAVLAGHFDAVIERYDRVFQE